MKNSDKGLDYELDILLEEIIEEHEGLDEDPPFEVSKEVMERLKNI